MNNRFSYVKGLIMEAMIQGSGRSANFSQKITQLSDLGHDVRRARLIKEFLWVCYNEELSVAEARWSHNYRVFFSPTHSPITR